MKSKHKYTKTTCDECETVSYEDGYEKGDKCEECGKPLNVRPITDPEDLIQIADDELENANRHGINAMDCWNGIKEFIPEDKQVKAAEALLDFFVSIC